MGKTKTAFVAGEVTGKLSSEEKYKQKQAKKKAEEALKSGAPNAPKVKTEEAEKEVVVKPEVAETKEPETVKTSEIKTDEVAVPEAVEGEEGKKKKIRVRGKKYLEAKAKANRDRLYSVNEAIKLIKSLSFAKFDETYELHALLKKKGVNINITLPHTFGKTRKVEVANDATIEKLKSASGQKGSGPVGKIDFDVLLATAEMMPKLVMFAKLLGPRGLMPNPRNGTLIKSAKDAEKFSAGQKNIKTEKEQPVIHTSVGKMSMDEKAVEENVNAIIDVITKAQFVKAYLKSTMSPSIKLQI